MNEDQGACPSGTALSSADADRAPAGLAAVALQPTGAEFSGWTSSDLGRAYSAVENARAEAAQPNGSGIDDAFRTALEAIETADCELEAARGCGQ